MSDAANTNVMCCFHGSAEQVYLCVRPCVDGVALNGNPARGDEGTLAMSQDSPGVWTTKLRLPPGWWRFRYYTLERGCLFYAAPSQDVLQMNGFDAMLHVCRAHAQGPRWGGLKGKRGQSSETDQFLCVLPEDHDDAHPRESDTIEEPTFDPPPGGERLDRRIAPAPPDAGMDHRHGRPGAWAGLEEAYKGTQAEALWRYCRPRSTAAQIAAGF